MLVNERRQQRRSTISHFLELIFKIILCILGITVLSRIYETSTMEFGDTHKCKICIENIVLIGIVIQCTVVFTCL